MALKTKVLLATTMLGSFALLAPTVTLAQTAPAAASDDTAVEEVVVTGSRIRRDPTNAPTPLIQVGRDEVVSTGQASVIDVSPTSRRCRARKCRKTPPVRASMTAACRY
jgi:outer membrane receptor protein involved in Fe transport